jgi:hypothetical protein
MKKPFFIMLVVFILTACGQGEKNTVSNDEHSGEQPQQIKGIDVTISAITDDEAFELIRSYIAEELDNNTYSGLYLAHEPFNHFVILIKESYSLQEVATDLEDYSKQMGRSEGEYHIKLKPATYSYQTLEKIANQLSASHEEIIKTERQVFSLSINEIENRIDLYVSAREDLNEELLADITDGMEGIIWIEEGVMSSVDDNGLPTEKPYIVGKIMETNKAENLVFLIEDQIYVSVNRATVIKDNNGNTIAAEELNLGDTVAVWTDGAISESLPASGYAVAIQIQ